MENTPKIIGFKDLSTSLKTLAVLCWVIVGVYGLAFLIGFLTAFLE